MGGSILNNGEAEALLLDIRTANRAAATIEGPPGAYLVFPTAVVVDRPGGGQLVFPTHVDIEPGTLCHHAGCATLTARIDGFDVRGSFSWVLGHGPGAVRPCPARYGFRRRGREVRSPSWAGQLPASSCLWAEPAAVLHRQRGRLLRRGQRAEYRLLRLSERALRQYCGGPVGRAIAARPHVDVDDVVQRGLQTASRLLPVYASSARPPSSWARALQLDGRRDLRREVRRLDWRIDGLASLSSFEPWDPSLAIPDPELDAVAEERGAGVGAIAAWAGLPPTLAGLATLGDAGAIRELGEVLVRTKREPGDTLRATRRRWRDEFGSTGRVVLKLTDTTGFEWRP